MILADVKRHLCLVYLDDAIVFSRSEEECGATAPRHPPGRGRAHRIAVAEVTAGPIPQRSLYSRVIPTAKTKDSGGDKHVFFLDGGGEPRCPHSLTPAHTPCPHAGPLGPPPEPPPGPYGPFTPKERKSRGILPTKSIHQYKSRSALSELRDGAKSNYASPNCPRRTPWSTPVPTGNPSALLSDCLAGWGSRPSANGARARSGCRRPIRGHSPRWGPKRGHSGCGCRVPEASPRFRPRFPGLWGGLPAPRHYISYPPSAARPAGVRCGGASGGVFPWSILCSEA